MFKMEKARDTEASSFAATANFMPGMFRLTPSSIGVNKSFGVGREHVMEYLQKNGASKMTDIMNTKVCSATTAKDAVYELVEMGKVRRVNAGGRGVIAIFELVKTVPTIRNRKMLKPDNKSIEKISYGLFKDKNAGKTRRL